MALPGFSPTARWRMALGARNGALHDVHEVDDFTVERGAHLGRGHTPVDLALNGREYSTGNVLFEYYPPPTVSSLTPRYGSVVGGWFGWWYVNTPSA